MPNGGEYLVDGQFDWTGGVDSITVPTIASATNPEGLGRNQLAWLVNGTVRDGGISPKAGWQPMGQVSDGTALYQGGIVYTPTAGDPYLLVLIGGHLYQVTFDYAPVVTDLSVASGGVFLPALQVQAFFVQAEQFVVIQAGDLTTLPLIYDPGAVPVLRQSVGLLGGPPAELPRGGPMCYYQGRIWIAQWDGKHRVVCAGDIVGDAASGTAPDYVDSILKVTENPLAVGGDGFRIPAGPGDIRGLQYSANLDATLGQGTLFIFTRDQIYSLTVPMSRSNWIASGNAASGAATDMPLLQVIQLTNGSVNDRSIVQANGDLFYQTISGDVASLSTAIKYFQQWGNTPVSANEFKITSRQDRALLRFVSGINFDNRLLMSALPKQLPQGVVSQAIIPMDFTPISTFGKTDPPSWGGHYEGLNWLQLFTADFGGLHRAFGLVVDALDSTIKMWELTQADKFENGDNRINWMPSFPAFDFGQPFEMKKLATMEIWIDQLWGTADFEVYIHTDQHPCPWLWVKFRECAARNVEEDINSILTYPPPTDYREQYRYKVLPLPPNIGCNIATGRPYNIGFQFQPVIKVTGSCRIRGILLKTMPFEKSLYTNLVTCLP